MITNRTQMSKEKFVKFNRDMLKLRTLPNGIIGTIGLVIGVALILCGVFIPNFMAIGLPLGIFFILLFTLLMLFPKMVEANAGKTFEANAKGLAVQEFEYIFEQDGLTIKNGKGKILAEGEYENIEQIVETPTDFYLVIEKKSCFGFIVDKEGFECGDSTALAQILQNAIPDYITTFNKN